MGFPSCPWCPLWFNNHGVSIATYNDAVRGLVAFLVVGTCALTFAQAPQQPKFTDRVDVARIVVDVRALDGMGRAIQGLTAVDFAVKIHGKAVGVESATSVGTGADASPAIAQGFRKEAFRRAGSSCLLPEGSRAAPHHRPDADAVQGEDVSRHAGPRRQGGGRVVRYP